VRERIRGYADAVVEQSSAAGELARLADDLAAIDSLLRSSTELDSVVADPGVPAYARRALLDDLLSGQVLPEALSLVSYCVDADRAPEVPSDIDWLSARAAASRDGREPLDEGPLGPTAAAERLDGYAGALLAGLEEPGRLDDLEDELFRFMRVVDGSDDLRAVLTDRDVPAAARRSLVEDLLTGRASTEAVRLAAYATQVGRPRDFVALLAGLVERIGAENNRRVADVVAAVELDDDQRRRLGDALSRITGRQVEVRVTVDRRVLGGFVATVGDTVVDGSLRHRLELLKERLVLPDATVTTRGDQN
jgi:F-type H+-transporting ATPase subunit delta